MPRTSRQDAFKTEAELAKVIVEWLQSQHFEVYQEVQRGPYTPIADILAVRSPYLWVIETKLQSGFRVIEQAWNWLPYAHYVSIAVPWQPRRYSSSNLEQAVMRQFGIGHLQVEHAINVVEKQHPTFNRKAHTAWVSRLNEKQKTFAQAGNNARLRWTPFTETRQLVQQFVKANPGCPLKELVQKVKTHYHSKSVAMRCITQYVESGVIPGIVIKRSGKKIQLFPKES